MSYKPDESVLIAWLYGELDAEEKQLVEQYIQDHPEVLQKVQELRGVLKIMGAVQDKEVIAPPIFLDQPQHLVFWRSGFFKTSMAIAASLLLLMVAGRLIGPEISYSKGNLSISFGNAPVAPANPVQTLSTAAVQDMINTSLVRTSASIDQHLIETRQQLDASVRQSLDMNARKVDELVKKSSLASQEQLRSYVSNLQAENVRVMTNYFQLSSKDQKDYVENLLVGFSKYIQEQRAQDMIMVQTKFNSLEKTSDQFKQETEQLLASIISNTTVKKNSY